MAKALIVILLASLATLILVKRRAHAAGAESYDSIRARVAPKLERELASKGLRLGSPIFMRVFKEEAQLEVWIRQSDGTRYALFKSYPICKFSGKLGPKLAEGDRQAPEGFYFVPRSAMNPHSSYHLSFDLGYPNAYDRSHGRTGSLLMVHGACVSIGCYAMTDPLIEEIYTLADAAFSGGQKYFRAHCFPFKMTPERMDRATREGGVWLPFWRNLKTGYDWFEERRIPPNVEVGAGEYRFLDK